MLQLQLYDILGAQGHEGISALVEWYNGVACCCSVVLLALPWPPHFSGHGKGAGTSM